MADSDSTFQTRPSLVLRIRDAQDLDAWAEFVGLYAPLVYRYGRRRGLQDADASDVAQEVLAQVSRSIGQFDYQPGLGRFRDWLGTIARHKVLDHLRGRRRAGQHVRGAAEGDPEATAATDGWDEEFNAHVLQVALERIRPRFQPPTWRAFEVVWLEARPVAEAARETGLAVNEVYVAKSRVLKALREEVMALAEDLPRAVPLD